MQDMQGSKVFISFLLTHAILEMDGSPGSGAVSGSGGASETRTAKVDHSTRAGATARGPCYALLHPAASRYFATGSAEQFAPPGFQHLIRFLLASKARLAARLFGCGVSVQAKGRGGTVE